MKFKSIYYALMVKANRISLNDFDSKYQTDFMCLNAIKNDWRELWYVKNKTEEICLAAVKRNGLALAYIEDQTDEICLAAVGWRGDVLKFVKNKTYEICLEAVKSDGWSLRHVEKQTEEICLAAVEHNGLALQFVEKQTEEICLAAVKKDGRALQYVENQTDEMCLIAIRRNGLNLEHVKNQTKEIYEMALHKNPLAILFIDESVYKYKKKQIKNFYRKNDSDEFGSLVDDKISDRHNFCKKLSIILLNLNNGDLARVVDEDLKIIFNDNRYIGVSSELMAIKEKVEMLKISKNNVAIKNKKSQRVL